MKTKEEDEEGERTDRRERRQYDEERLTVLWHVLRDHDSETVGVVVPPVRVDLHSRVHGLMRAHTGAQDDGGEEGR